MPALQALHGIEQGPVAALDAKGIHRQPARDLAVQAGRDQPAAQDGLHF